MRRTPALILGGGPAGATAAITLARGGMRPLIIERTRETGDALCGGFLSWRTLQALTALGIEVDHLNRNRVTRVRLFAGARLAEADLPQPAIGVSRHRLDTILLDHARVAGAAVERGCAVRELTGNVARLDDAAELTGDAVLLATGKNDVRGAGRPAAAVDPAIGLRVRLEPSPTLTRLVKDAIELHLFDRGYAGCMLHEDGSANLCMAVRRSRLREAGDPAGLLRTLAAESDALGDRLAEMASEQDISAVANVPYGWRARTTQPGVYRLGDQAGVIPSLAGEGMGIAIASGRMAAQAILSGIDASQFQHHLASALTRPMAIAAMVSKTSSHMPSLLVDLARRMPWLVRHVADLTRISQSDVDVRGHRHH